MNTVRGIALAATLAIASLNTAFPQCDNQPTTMPLPTGKYITPQGSHVGVGSFPVNMAMTPDGRYIVVTNTGVREYLTVVRTSDGTTVSQVAFQLPGQIDSDLGVYYGLAFAPGEYPLTLFASRGTEETIAQYSLDTNGQLEELHRTLDDASGDSSQKNIPAGIALSSDGHTLYAANNRSFLSNGFYGSLAVIDVATNTRQLWQTSGFPFSVAALADGRKVYVTSERDKCVAVMSTSAKAQVSSITVGQSPMALLLNRAQTRLYVANAGSDTVSVISTATDRVERTIQLRGSPMRNLPSATPTGLAFSPDEKRLYVTMADANAVAVVRIPQGTVEGCIPTGWYPTSVVASQDGTKLFVSCGNGVLNPNPNNLHGRVLRPDAWTLNLLEGTVSMIPLPSTRQLQVLTRAVTANNTIPPARPQKALRNPGITHIFYIIKENRTYDQVMGDLPRGNNCPDLCVYGERITPNQHALQQRFVQFDNFYCCAEASAQGWNCRRRRSRTSTWRATCPIPTHGPVLHTISRARTAGRQST